MLKKCPNCGHEIPDKANFCPNCGQAAEKAEADNSKFEKSDAESTEFERNEAESPNKEKTESESSDDEKIGDEIPEYKIADTESSEEGKNEENNVEIKNVPEKKRKSKKCKKVIISVIAVLIVVALCVGLYAYKDYKTKQRLNSYSITASAAVIGMLKGGAEAETTANLICAVWHNSIYEVNDPETNCYTKDINGLFYDDFNDALSQLLRSDVYKEHARIIEKYKTAAAKLMSQLVDPPEEYAAAYSELLNLYDSYIDLSNLALTPKGSYSTYPGKVSDADSDFMKYYERMSLYGFDPYTNLRNN